jgi:hypothetical protein
VILIGGLDFFSDWLRGDADVHWPFYVFVPLMFLNFIYLISHKSSNPSSPTAHR